MDSDSALAGRVTKKKNIVIIQLISGLCDCFPFFSSMSVTLPISVYVYDRRSRHYVFESCLQSTVAAAPLPRCGFFFLCYRSLVYVICDAGS